MGVLSLAQRLLEKYYLCDYCLGRQFSSLLPGAGNKIRGLCLKMVLALEAHENILRGGNSMEELRLLAGHGKLDLARRLAESVGQSDIKQDRCFVCEDVLNDGVFDGITDKVMSELVRLEFRTFLVGASVPVHIRQREDYLRAENEITTGEDIKGDITREVGKRITDRTGAKVEFFVPEVTIVVDIFSNSYVLKNNPIFIKGFYQKYVRNLPQSIWFCKKCHGTGCDACGGSGREYTSSVSELIGKPAVQFFGAADFKFHAAGREDVDATVLGRGRPFVLEIKSPGKRYLQLGELEERINANSEGRISAKELGYAAKKDMRALKAESIARTKTYLAEVVFDEMVEDSKIVEVENVFRNISVEQRTPSRVLGRRKDKIRRKLVHTVVAERKDRNAVSFKVKAQGGLYIKELINGDNGRTVPNIADTVGRKVLVISLSVIEVES